MQVRTTEKAKFWYKHNLFKGKVQYFWIYTLNNQPVNISVYWNSEKSMIKQITLEDGETNVHIHVGVFTVISLQFKLNNLLWNVVCWQLNSRVHLLIQALIMQWHVHIVDLHLLILCNWLWCWWLMVFLYTWELTKRCLGTVGIFKKTCSHECLDIMLKGRYITGY